MARFDVHANGVAAYPPFLLSVQSAFLEALPNRVVIPFFPADAAVGNCPKELRPVFEIEGGAYALLVPEIASVPRAALGRKVASLANEHSRIVAALDFLMEGF